MNLMRLYLIPLKIAPRDVAANLSELERRLREERRVYLDGVRAVRVTTAIVNALEVAEKDASFGGALIVDRNGRLLAESPHGTDTTLVYEL